MLDAIRRAGTIARIDLAQKAELSQASVTTLTAEMLRMGLIEECARAETGDSRRGRPRVDLKLRGAAHVVAGVKFANQSVSVVLSDFEGQILAKLNTSLQQTVFSPTTLAAQIKSAVAATAQSAGLSMGDISAVGVGIAGTVDAPAGTVHWSPSLDQRNVPLREVAAAALNLPVFVDNDANLVAMAEQYFGEGRNVTDYLVITIESGVGMGIVLNNELYRGARGCGAEFGHTKVQLDGALCRCGQRGCLEAYVADYALLREAQVAQGLHSNVDTLLQAARDGDPMAQSIVHRASRMFAMGLANLVNIFDPQLIILAGERMSMDHLYAEEVIGSIRQSIVQVDLAPPQIKIHQWDDYMWARGAAAFAIDGVIDLTFGTRIEHVA